MSTDLLTDEPLTIGSHTLRSRLIVGTGKYASYELMGESLERSGTDCITVAVRRERLIDAAGNNLLDFIDTSRYTLLPNTAGCFSADDAVRVARLGREILLGLENPGAAWVKLEVLADKKTLLPDPVASIEATERAETAWVEHVNERAKETLYLTADSYYNGAEVKGKPRVFMPYSGGVRGYRRILKQCAEEGYSGFALRKTPAAAAHAGQKASA